jgi:hypothetical protein
VHTEGAIVVKVTFNPDEAMALTVTGDRARVVLARATKAIVWLTRLVVTTMVC